MEFWSLFSCNLHAVPDADIINIDFPPPDISSMSMCNPSIASPPFFKVLFFRSDIASSLIISSFLSYELDLPPNISDKDAAMSENILVPITKEEQTKPKYS